MATIDQIEDFNRFARQLSAQEGADVSMDEIYDRWRAEAHRDEDLQAIQASVRDYERGERGRPIEEFLAEFDATRRADRGK